MEEETKHKVKIEDLAIGLFVELDQSWTGHPFLFSRFEIQTEQQLSCIRQLGVSEITVIPELSEINPDAVGSVCNLEEDKKIVEQLWQEKRVCIEKAAEFRERRGKVAKEYQVQSEAMQDIAKELPKYPVKAIGIADEMIRAMLESFQGEQNMLTNLVNLGAGRHTLYNHSINVTVLSLTLGSSLGLESDELHQLGMGALLHDIGKIEIPDKILLKISKLDTYELKQYKQHVSNGRKLAEQVRSLPKQSLDIISQHHEFLDGTGYPEKINGDDISKLVRIVSIANVYDDLCNPIKQTDAIEPKTALAIMYTRFKDKLDNYLVQSLVRKLGVYPPGAVVKLNDDSIGLVVSVDPEHLTNPEVLIYNPGIPKDKAIHINLLDHKSLSIEKVLKPGSYPARIYEYLGIGESIGYFFEMKPG